jgi:hypothetical protein
MQGCDEREHQKDAEQKRPMQILQKLSHNDTPVKFCGLPALTRTLSQATPDINSLKVQSRPKTLLRTYGAIV